MASKEIIRKLTPAYFKNGESFDSKSFSSLIDALLKLKSNAWKRPVIWVTGLLLAAICLTMEGVIPNIMAVVCLFAGLIGGNLSVLGAIKQIKVAKKELGINQSDINAALRKVKAELQKKGVTETVTPADTEQTPVLKTNKTIDILFKINSVLVILIHAAMVVIFIANAIDGDSQTAEYSIFGLGSALAITGVVLMMKKRLWAYALVVFGIVLFCVGMGDELNHEITTTILILMSVLSITLLFTAFRQRSEEQQATRDGKQKPFRLTWIHLLLTTGATVAVIFATLTLSRGKYEQVNWKYDFYMAQVRDTGKWGFLDKDKKQEILPCIYDEVDRTFYILKVKLDGKWGIFSKKGKEIMPCRYDYIGEELSDSYLYVMNNKKYGLINFNGREVVPCIYEKLLDDRSSDLLIAVLDGKYGFIDRTGKQIIPIQYDKADFNSKHGFWADLKDERTFFDLQGKQLDGDPTVVVPVLTTSSSKDMMNVKYDGESKTFEFTDVETGKVLEFSRIMIGDVEPIEMRYDFSQSSGSMIQFVTKAAEVLGTRQENGETIIIYSGESTTSFPLYNALPYALEEGVLIIKR